MGDYVHFFSVCAVVCVSGWLFYFLTFKGENKR